MARGSRVRVIIRLVRYTVEHNAGTAGTNADTLYRYLGVYFFYSQRQIVSYLRSFPRREVFRFFFFFTGTSRIIRFL